MSRRSDKISFSLALGLHILLIGLLVVNFNKTIRLASSPPVNQVEPQKEIIDAVMVDKKTLQDEVARLEEKEAQKKAIELEHKRELERRETQAKQKREKEEALAHELKIKNEALKKQAEQLQLAEQKREKERKAKLKKEQDELKKLQKEKEEAIAAKKKLEQEQKQAKEKQKEKELAEQKARQLQQQQEISARASQGEINRYMQLIKNKIDQNWRQPIGFDFNSLVCKVLVKLLPTGEVVEASVITSSGNLEFDRSAELAVSKSSPLPMPEDPHIAKEFREFEFTFRPGAA